jgi:hypothetical protein
MGARVRNPVKTQNQAAPLASYVTLREVARQLSESYYTAYSLAARGLLAEPLVVGRSHPCDRATAESAIQRRLEQRRQRDRRATVPGAA